MVPSRVRSTPVTDGVIGVIVADTRLRVLAVHADDGLPARIGWDPGALCARSLAGHGVRATWPELLPACVSAVGGDTVAFERTDGGRTHRVEVEPVRAHGAVARIVLTIHERDGGPGDVAGPGDPTGTDDAAAPAAAAGGGPLRRPSPVRRAPLPVDDGTSLFWRGFAEAPTAMAIIDPVGGRFVRVNDALCALSGHARELLLSGTIDELLHPDDRGVVRDLRQGMEGTADASLRYRRRYVRADGAVAPVEVHLIPVCPAGSRPTCLAHIVALDGAGDGDGLAGADDVPSANDGARVGGLERPSRAAAGRPPRRSTGRARPGA